eukprot:818408_1
MVEKIEQDRLSWNIEREKTNDEIAKLKSEKVVKSPEHTIKHTYNDTDNEILREKIKCLSKEVDELNTENAELYKTIELKQTEEAANNHEFIKLSSKLSHLRTRSAMMCAHSQKLSGCAESLTEFVRSSVAAARFTRAFFIR